MKKLLSAVALAGIVLTGLATTANAQLYRDYCNWPYYSPYAGWNPNFVHTSSFTYKINDGDYVRSGFTIQPTGSPYWDEIPLSTRTLGRPLVDVRLF